jgi:uncharacterized membrane protein
VSWIWNRLHRRADERGAVLFLAAAGIVLAMIAAGLAIDLGRIAAEKRTNQKVADLAALDAVRSLPGDPTGAARDSATRNGFNPADYLLAEAGTWQNGTFTPGPPGTADAVRVTVRSEVTDAFIPGTHSVMAVGIASAEKIAAFSIGSKLAAVGLDNTITNRLLSGMLGGNINVLSYDGIATSSVELGRLQSQLGFGSVDDLMNADLTMGQLLNATTTMLTSDGVAAAAEVNQISATLTNTTTFRLGDMIDVATGAEDAAAKTQLNVLQMITGGAILINGANFAAGCLNITNLPSVTVASVGNTGTSMCIKVIEPPKIYIGPEGGSVSTSQVELTFNTNVSVNVGVPPLASVAVSGTLPVKIAAAGATGTLTDIDCSGGNAGITVDVVAAPVPPASVTASNLTATATVLGIPASASFPATVASASVSNSSETLDFDYPSEFTPTAQSKSTTQQPMNVGTTVSSSGGNLTIGAISLPLGTLTNAVTAAIAPLVTQLQAQAVLPAFRALGISVGAADVAALRDYFNPSTCGSPTLVG